MVGVRSDNKVWVIPAERMKTDVDHVVPLSDEVIALLKSLPRFHQGDHLFSTTFGKKPVNGFSKAKARLDRRMWAGRAIARLHGEGRRKLDRALGDPRYSPHDAHGIVRATGVRYGP